MKKINIRIITWGTLDEKILKCFNIIKSDLFEIISCNQHKINEPDGNGCLYPDKVLEELKILEISQDTLTIVFSQFPLTDRYTSNYPEKYKHIVSLYDAKRIIRGTDLKIKNFIEIMLIKSILYVHAKIPDKIHHSDIRGCVFDLYTRDKYDLIEVLSYPHICDKCCDDIEKEEQNNGDLQKDFFKELNSEFKKLRPNLFLRLKALVKEHIIISLLFAGFISIYSITDKPVFNPEIKNKIGSPKNRAYLLSFFNIRRNYLNLKPFKPNHLKLPIILQSPNENLQNQNPPIRQQKAESVKP